MTQATGAGVPKRYGIVVEAKPEVDDARAQTTHRAGNNSLYSRSVVDIRPTKLGRQHCHETTQPFVNHLSVNASGINAHTGTSTTRRPPTNHWLFNCSIQCTTNRRRSSGDFTGKSLAFSVSSIGRTCRFCLDQRLCMDERTCMCARAEHRQGGK
jgi:hypothetical protein